MDFSTLNRIICNAIGVDERHISGYTLTGDESGVTIKVKWLPQWAKVEPQQKEWQFNPAAGETVLLGDGAVPGPDQPETNPKPEGYIGEWHMAPEVQET